MQRASSRQIWHLDFIFQFTTDIRNISGSNNFVADYLSRSHDICLTDFKNIASNQAANGETNHIIWGENKSQLKLISVKIPGSENTIYCDVSQQTPPTFLWKNTRFSVFQNIHHLSHHGVRATRKFITDRFVWSSMKSDIAKWVRSCIERFTEVHIDLVGPLPPSQGKCFLTCINRFTRWPEKIPIENSLAEAICDAFYNDWIQPHIIHKVTDALDIKNCYCISQY